MSNGKNHSCHRSCCEAGLGARLSSAEGQMGRRMSVPACPFLVSFGWRDGFQQRLERQVVVKQNFSSVVSWIQRIFSSPLPFSPLGITLKCHDLKVLSISIGWNWAVLHPWPKGWEVAVAVLQGCRGGGFLYYYYYFFISTDSCNMQCSVLCLSIR